jgi:hypothetical protein
LVAAAGVVYSLLDNDYDGVVDDILIGDYFQKSNLFLS